MKLNKIYCEDCLEGMKKLDDNSVDLTITSPPYDNLRDYEGYTFDFENIAQELYRITKLGGGVVWIVNDATINGSESGTSFKQALFFKKIGFNLHDTMIWKKQTFTDTGSLKVRYCGVFEYMFIFSKDKIKTFNPIKDRKNKEFGRKKHGTVRQKDGSIKPISLINKKINKYGQRFNVWEINTEVSNSKRIHPAQFSEELAKDHISSWSNTGDLVLDPFMGSGTTAVACKQLNRNFIGFEISQKYVDIANKRLQKTIVNKSIFDYKKKTIFDY